ncbi:MAG: phosphoglycerate dehydrogenase, partial [Armatimonadetes bacterium]|nr:phosphoglycerate dehydrogenase [Armatimonadota bacterium]NIM24238.1 phosphoglycerate dehydrogenase [Armatimonadota bacterium]NIM68107.1 phosphoglycerate dehydrogenase [Armatimonadota bacterium]NIM76569.1 phosphoglycerate dehydrogenase [Armatimonadota bacterium]NIN06312.1 phosphoglycerate dehydrogenase [Armatimonadota bacterium]
EVVISPSLSVEELKEKIPDYHALIVRSQTKVTAEALEPAKQLKVIARAGVGVDNVDIPAATRRGIVVCNSPGGNTLAATEHTWALLLALSRNVPRAEASLRQGEWKRSQFVGVELYGKTLGVVGLGKIGSEVARRGLAFGMKVLAHDPFISVEQAQRLGVSLAELPDLLAQSDYVTLHLPLTKSTQQLINAETLALCKTGMRLINCSRGGVVDEAALAEALKNGQLAGAACDVFENEPPEGSPLLGAPNAILTPHLGASTKEAQVKVAVDVAEQVLEVLRDRPARSAVNAMGFAPELLELLGPYLELAEKIGSMHSQLLEGQLTEAELTYSGDLADTETAPLTMAFLKGLLGRSQEEPINMVNARLVADSLGLQVKETKTSAAQDYASLLSARVRTGKEEHLIAGTLFGKKEGRIVRFDDYPVDFAPSGPMLFALHYDRPGVIGAVGTLLGSNKINIAAMHVGRHRPGDFALMVLAVDSPISASLIKKIDEVEHIVSSRLVEV